MELSKDDIRNLARTASLDIPDTDLHTVALRLSGLLALMEQIENELGAELYTVDPVPPVYPRESFGLGLPDKQLSMF